MLTVAQKEAIQKINIYDSIWKKEDGTIITPNKKDIVVPNFFEIKKMILQKLKEYGVSKIECVKPYRANCIIRVYQHLNYQYDSTIISLYGVKCYIKVDQIWTTYCNERINFSQLILREWLFQDEYIDHDCEFYDCYVKIS